MRIFTLFVTALAILFLSHIHAIPIDRSLASKDKSNFKRRQIEEDVIQAAEERIQLFDFPRTHDSAEQLHEGTSKHNITAQSIMDAVRKRRNALRQKLWIISMLEPRYRYIQQPPQYVSNDRLSGIGGYGRQTEGFEGYQQEGYAAA